MGDQQNALVPVRDQQLSRIDDFMPIMTVAQAVQRKGQINEFIEKVLRPETDYGAIPGAGLKPVLLKPGAEKLCSIFGLAPCYEAEQTTEDWTGEDHDGEAFFYYRYKCRLYRGDRPLGEAVGSANSWESKYRYRDTKRACPECGQSAIIAGKQEYGGGWLCWKKQGGCGGKFTLEDKRITDQPVGRVPNPDVADQVNTIQKMAQKRALVAAVLVVTNCSDAFTQDLEDIDTGGAPKNTQAAADHVANRKIHEMQEKNNGREDAELAPLLKKLDAGDVDACFDFIQDQAIKAGGEPASKAYTARIKALGDRCGKEQRNPTVSELKGAALIEWTEVKRLRAEKGRTA